MTDQATEDRSVKPIIGIAQSGSDLAPCNRVHLELAEHVKAGIRDAGGIPAEFPTHPIHEQGRRPTAALDRNFGFLSLVEILHKAPIDAVVLTTGCDKTTPFALMAASAVDIPAISLNGGPMLDGWHGSERVGSGTIIWRLRRKLAAGEITEDEFFERALQASPSVGHCNTMGTALTMNSVSEALGMSLPGNAAIPAPYDARRAMAFATGRRIVEMAHENLRPSQILTRASFLNAIRVTTAIGGSSNAQPHIMAMARHAGVELSPADFMAYGYDLPLLVNMQPAGDYLSEDFFRAGGVPAVIRELIRAGRFDGDELTVTGRTHAENLAAPTEPDRRVIAAFDRPFKEKAGFILLTGNLFDCAIMKSSVISDDFRARYLSRPGAEGIFEGRAIVFDGSEDYHHRINDPALGIDEQSILVMRGAGPIGWPGSAEVVNMQPPDALLQRGIMSLPTIGDGRQSGTSDSPSILNASPESAVGGGLALLRTGDTIRVDLNAGRCDVLLDEDELNERRKDAPPPIPESSTPWEELFRAETGQLSSGAVLERAVAYRRIRPEACN